MTEAEGWKEIIAVDHSREMVVDGDQNCKSINSIQFNWIAAQSIFYTVHESTQHFTYRV